MYNELIKLLSLILSSLVILFICHIIIVRVIVFLKIDFSLQKLLLYLIILFNIVVFALYAFSFHKKYIYDCFFMLVVYNSCSYFYFHLFNMSETARRIKILLNVRGGKIKRTIDLEKYYDYKETLNIRLKRLEELGQIKKIDGYYFVKGKILLYVSVLIVLFRKILGFK